jgi:hypothetical protein
MRPAMHRDNPRTVSRRPPELCGPGTRAQLIILLAEVTDRAQQGEPALRAADRVQEIGELDLVFTAQERATLVSSGRHTT